MSNAMCSDKVLSLAAQLHFVTKQYLCVGTYVFVCLMQCVPIKFCHWLHSCSLSLSNIYVLVFMYLYV